MNNIVLFDIDGTLLLSGSAGQQAIEKTLKLEFQIETPARVPIHGQTDRGIAGSFFEQHGLSNNDEVWLQFRDSYLVNLPHALAECEGNLLPGVSEILARLDAREDVALGLLTGNTRQGAFHKLEHYGIAHYFSFGGFGDVHPCRNDVASAAMKSAQEHLGWAPDPQRTWVLGDTPNDIRCGRSIGANVLAVSTGGYPYDELAECEPDLVLEDLSDVDLVCRTLAGDA